MQQDSPTAGTTLHWFDVSDGQNRSWPVTTKESLPVSLLATSSGIAAFVPGLNGSTSQLQTYAVSGASSTTGTIVSGFEALPNGEDFVSMVPSFESNTYTIYRIAPSGSASSVTTPPGSADPNQQTLVNWAIAPDGHTLAAERGDHTDGCGDGPPSKIETIDLDTGAVSRYPLPSGPRWRVISLTYSLDGKLEVVAADTSSACAFSGGFPKGDKALMPTTLFELDDGTLHRTTGDVLAAQRSSTGEIATISGEWRLALARDGDFSLDAPTGAQRLHVGSTRIAVPGLPLSLSWAPDS
jgi:hypothetical protein